jgi:hypothetical protein
MTEKDITTYKCYMTDAEQDEINKTVEKLFSDTNTYGDFMDALLDASLSEKLKVIAAFIAGETMARNEIMGNLQNVMSGKEK